MMISPAVQGSESQWRQDRTKPDRHPMTGDRRASSRASAEHQFNPHRNRIIPRPSVSRMLSRHEHCPVPSLQDVINGLPSRNMGGKEGPVVMEEF
jgi:hypothetical protein